MAFVKINKRCPKCMEEHFNRNARFCKKCGSQLDDSTKCSKCGNIVAKKDNFCTYCGKKSK